MEKKRKKRSFDIGRDASSVSFHLQKATLYDTLKHTIRNSAGRVQPTHTYD
jgi:hypothetical protein